MLSMLDAAEGPVAGPGGGGYDPALKFAGVSRPILGRFEVLEQLGSGGFGFVVRARDLTLGREVALKMPLPERVMRAGDFDRFLKEARAAARLDHSSIVRVYDAGTLGPFGYFIAAEYCAGDSLRQWLKTRNEPVPPRIAARWLSALADAVQHAHDRGILHRDIKPDNVIMTASTGLDETKRAPTASAQGGDLIHLVPRLTDFGLATLIEDCGTETGSNVRTGTPYYMAPEQAAGRRGEIGPATDVYGLGSTLFEVLTGRPPFRGETEVETLRLVLETERFRPDRYVPACHATWRRSA